MNNRVIYRGIDYTISSSYDEKGIRGELYNLYRSISMAFCKTVIDSDGSKTFIFTDAPELMPSEPTHVAPAKLAAQDFNSPVSKPADNLGKAVQTQGAVMSEQSGKPSRVSQLLTGGKSGLKKGTINVVSEKASKAIAGHLPIGGKPTERFVQHVLLTAAAEIIERVPAAVANKVGLNEDRRLSAGGALRFQSGEIMGFDMVDMMQQFSPLVIDMLGKMANVSAEEVEASADEITTRATAESEEQPAEQVSETVS